MGAGICNLFDPTGEYTMKLDIEQRGDHSFQGI